MKVYIGGKFKEETRKHLRIVRDKVRELGFPCQSTWLDVDPDADAAPEALRDLEQIRESDILIVDTSDESTTGGREVEIGFALGLGLSHTVWIVGPDRNVFHSLLPRFNTWTEAIAALSSLPDNN